MGPVIGAVLVVIAVTNSTLELRRPHFSGELLGVWKV